MAVHRALVIGGTGFFGIDLVNCLLDSGWNVSVATERCSPAPFRGQPERLRVDRHDPDSLARLAKQGSWDVVYDQRCYSSLDAQNLLDTFASKTGKIVYTSSTAVYQPGGNIGEASFDPLQHRCTVGPRANYDQGKRDAEAVYAQQTRVSVAMGRLAVVIGFPDSSHRLIDHIEAIVRGEPIYLPCPEAKTSLIGREDAGRFIATLGMLNVTGPVNGAAQPIALGEFYSTMAAELGRDVRLSSDVRGAYRQSYGRDFDTFLDVSRAADLGMTFKSVQEFLPPYVQEVKQLLRSVARERPQGMQP